MPINYGAPPNGLGESKGVLLVLFYSKVLDYLDISKFVSFQQGKELTLVGVDSDGNDDPIASREMYQVLYEYSKRSDPSYYDAEPY